MKEDALDFFLMIAATKIIISSGTSVFKNLLLILIDILEITIYSCKILLLEIIAS